MNDLLNSNRYVLILLLLFSDADADADVIIDWNVKRDVRS
jgi:hypothetical protein